MSRLPIIANELRAIGAKAGMPEEGELNYWAWEVELVENPLLAHPECPVCKGAFVAVDLSECSACGYLIQCDSCGKTISEKSATMGSYGSYCAACKTNGQMAEKEAEDTPAFSSRPLPDIMDIADILIGHSLRGGAA